MTICINVSDAPAEWWKDKDTFCYVGRFKKFGASGLGNPYIIGVDGDRTEVISLYIQWMKRKVKSDSFQSKLSNMNGKILVCHCKPEACHGDVLSSLSTFMAELDGSIWSRDPDFNRHHREWMISQHVEKIERSWCNSVIHGLCVEAEKQAGKVDSAKTFWQYRDKYLTPALRWNMPLYRPPKSAQGKQEDGC